MFTKNYALAQMCKMLPNQTSTGLYCMLYNGSNTTLWANTLGSTDITGSLNNPFTSGSAPNTSGVVFGDGTVAPQYTDYKLSGNIIGGISTLKNVTSTCEDGKTKWVANYTITNNNSTDITISEIGLIVTLGTAKSSGGATLAERTLLDSPVTIPAGGVGQITYTIEYNYPTA